MSDLRETLIGIVLLGSAMGFANLIVGGMQLRAFARDVAAIQSFHDMERFKQMVSIQMYCALLQIVFMVVPLVVVLGGYATKRLNDLDFLYVLVPSVIILIAGMMVKRLESEVKAIEVSEEYEAEFEKIVDTWMTKPFPNW